MTCEPKVKKLVLILFERSPITVLSTYQLPPLVHWSPTLNLDRIFDVLNKSYWLESKMDGHWWNEAVYLKKLEIKVIDSSVKWTVIGETKRSFWTNWFLKSILDEIWTALKPNSFSLNSDGLFDLKPTIYESPVNVKTCKTFFKGFLDQI